MINAHGDTFTMNHNKFRLHLTNDNTKGIEGVFSWNGTDDDLGVILQDAMLAGGAANTGRVGDNSDVSFVLLGPDKDTTPTPRSVDTAQIEEDPVGASSFVIAVVLIYGFSIVFLIASHVFIKKRGHHKDSEKQISKYLEQAPQLQDESRRESFKKLKRSLIPMIAQSPSGRALIAKRVKYTPYLIQYLPFTALGSKQGSKEAGLASSQQLNTIVEDPATDVPKVLITPSTPPSKAAKDHKPRNGSITVRKPQSPHNHSRGSPTRTTDVVVHVHSDSVEESSGNVTEDHRDVLLNRYLYGDKSLEDILETEVTDLEDEHSVRYAHETVV